MSSHHIALFTFTLSGTASIGPQALRALWAKACGIGNVSVGRKDAYGSQRAIYTLYAPQSLGGLQDVEMRLRRALEDAHLHASVTALH